MPGNFVYSMDMSNHQGVTMNQHDDTNPDCHLNQNRTGMLDLGCICEWTEEDGQWLRRTTD